MGLKVSGFDFEVKYRSIYLNTQAASLLHLHILGDTVRTITEDFLSVFETRNLQA